MTKPAIKKPSLSHTSPRRSIKQPATFEYFAPSAVTVAGTFNQWDPEAHPLRPDTGGLWRVTLQLKSGTYQYKFVIDGQHWEEDPVNLNRVLNEHGTFNSIRNIDPFTAVSPQK